MNAEETKGAEVHQLTEALWSYPGGQDLGFKEHCGMLAEWLIERGYTLLPRCPECVQGKHRNCTGWAMNVVDDIVGCECRHGD